MWEEGPHEAWLELKRHLVNSPILAYPDPELPSILDTDASVLGIELKHKRFQQHTSLTSGTNNPLLGFITSFVVFFSIISFYFFTLYLNLISNVISLYYGL